VTRKRAYHRSRSRQKKVWISISQIKDRKLPNAPVNPTFMLPRFVLQCYSITLVSAAHSPTDSLNVYRPSSLPPPTPQPSVIADLCSNETDQKGQLLS
jgi:hypothetical protein